MAKLIRQRQQRTVVEYCRHITYRDEPGAGFAFDCDEQGNPLCTPETKPRAWENWQWCQDNPDKVVDHGIREESWIVYEPAVLRCDCKAEVELHDAMTNACQRCGQLYNGFGQALAPVEQWEPEDRQSLGLMSREDYEYGGW